MTKKEFRVSCVWQEMGSYYFEAEDEEEARQMAMDEPLPQDSSYVEDSFEIDSITEIKFNPKPETHAEQMANDLRDALSAILEEPDLKIPTKLRQKGLKACQAHEQSLKEK